MFKNQFTFFSYFFQIFFNFITLPNHLLVISRLKPLFHLLSHLLSYMYLVYFHNPPFPHHKIIPQKNSEVGVFLLFSTLQISAKNSTSSWKGVGNNRRVFEDKYHVFPWLTSILGAMSTPRSFAVIFSTFFFLAFMMLGSVAYLQFIHRSRMKATIHWLSDQLVLQLLQVYQRVKIIIIFTVFFKMYLGSFSLRSAERTAGSVTQYKDQCVNIGDCFNCQERRSL